MKIDKTWLVLPLAIAACGGEPEVEETQRARLALAEPGPWHIPAETLAIGDMQFVEYTGAGAWVGESGCYPGITPGMSVLRDYLYAHFPQTYSIGGYSCRPINGNPDVMSVHATGRALDIMLHLDDGEADNDAGDPIGNWLIENAEAIGIQFIIWDLYTWGAERTPGAKGRDYGGAHPHHDHLHIELSVAASENTEVWFQDAVTPPVLQGCDALPIAGGVIEETSQCFRAFGPSEYWREVSDAGNGGALIWTNAYENDNPSNWARWNVPVEEAGSYTLEVYVDPEYGVHRETRYSVSTPSGVEELIVNQSEQTGWVTLGEYELSPTQPAWVDVLDNSLVPVEDNQQIAVDALRVTGVGFEPPGTDPPVDPDPTEPPVDDDPELEVEVKAEASCSAGPTPGSAGGWGFAALLGLAAAAVRRRR